MSRYEDLEKKYDKLCLELEKYNKIITQIEMSLDIIFLTTKGRTSHLLLHNSNNSLVPGIYENLAMQAREKGFYIRKTYNNGTWELWLEHE